MPNHALADRTARRRRHVLLEGPAVSGDADRPHRARLVQGVADLGRRSPAPWPTAGSGPGPTTRSCSARWRTAARARSRRSRRPAAGSGGRRTVRDPLGRQIDARMAASPTTGGAPSIEMAEASGLSRARDGRARPDPRDLGRDRRPDPGRAGRPASRSIVLGIGGSATTDGGAGLLTGLGGHRGPGYRHGRSRRPRRAPRRRSSCRSPATSRTRCCGPTGRGRGLRPAEGRHARAGRWTSTAGSIGSRTRSTPRPAGPSALTPGAGAAGGVGYALLSIQDRFRGVRAAARAWTS